MRNLWKSMGLLIGMGLLIAGCCNYRLYGPIVNTSKWTNGEFSMAIMAVAAKKGGGIYRRGALEYELAEKLAASYIEDDVMNNKRKYQNIAASYEVVDKQLKKNPNIRPVEFSFVDRQRIEELLQEQDFGQTDRVDERTAAKFGKIMGAKAILFVRCTLQVSGKKEEQVYDTKKVVYYKNVKDPKTGKIRKERRVRYIQVPRKIGGRSVIEVSRLVRVKCNARLIDVASSRVLYTKVTESQTFRISAQIREGERAQLDIKGAAEESLRSLGHKIGRVFYPIVSRACLGGTPVDPRISGDTLYNDLTWSD